MDARVGKEMKVKINTNNILYQLRRTPTSDIFTRGYLSRINNKSFIFKSIDIDVGYAFLLRDKFTKTLSIELREEMIWM